MQDTETRKIQRVYCLYQVPPNKIYQECLIKQNVSGANVYIKQVGSNLPVWCIDRSEGETPCCKFVNCLMTEFNHY